MIRQRGRPQRLKDASALADLQDAEPAFYLRKINASLPPGVDRSRYREALEQTAKKFNMSKRTVERRCQKHREIVDLVMKGLRRHTLSVRQVNTLKTAIATGRGNEPAKNILRPINRRKGR